MIDNKNSRLRIVTKNNLELKNIEAESKTMKKSVLFLKKVNKQHD